MRNFLMVLALAFPALSSAAESCEPVYKCECAQQVPFEAWVMYMVERCGDKEQWYLIEPSPRQYDDEAACGAAIREEVECPE